MRRRAITRKEREVWEACALLKNDNNNLTYYAIGEQLIKLGYKRGSNSDIRRYLTTWKKHHFSSKSTDVIQPSALLCAAEHEPKISYSQVNNALLSSESGLFQEVLSVAQHYAKQFDRLLKVNECLRKENRLLKARIKKINTTSTSSLVKPRYTLKAVFEKI